MHIRVTPGHLHPGKTQEATAILQEVFAAYRQAGGFQGGYVGADDQSGEGVVVSLWDSEDAALAATQQAGPSLAKLAPLMASGQTPTPPRAYEVLLQG